MRPSSHPSLAKCKDCDQIGHRSAKSHRCSKNETKGDFGTSEVANATLPNQAYNYAEKLPKPSFFQRASLINRVNVVVPEDVPKNGLRHRIAKRHKTESSKDVYVFDSGCNQSILFNKEKLSNYLPFSTTMSTADNGTLMCISKGDLALNNSILATTVLYCPQVSLNLIATSQLCNLGFTLEMDKTRIVVKEKTKVVLIVPRTEGLYSYSIPPERALLLKGSNRTELIHIRLCHLNYK